MTLTPSSGSSNLSTPAKQKEQASACSFCFTCEAVKERFELRATPPGGKTVLRTVFSDDRRYLQSIGLSRHLKNIFSEGELDEKVVVAKITTTTPHGAIVGKTQTTDTQFYNLDAIIS